MSAGRSWIWAAVAAVVAVLVTVGVVQLLSGDDSQPAGSSSTPTPTVTPSPTPTPDETPAPTEEPLTLVAAYFLGETPRGTRLFREFQRVEGTQPVAAVEAALTGPSDPDYSSPWTDLDVSAASVEADDSVITVDLTADDADSLASAPAGLDAVDARLAVQALVRTAQGATEAGRTPVLFLVNSDPATRLLGIKLNGPVKAGNDLKDLANVWINTPLEGDTVSVGSTVEGVAITFEATVRWQVLQGTTVVEEGFTTAAEGMKRSPYSFEFPDVPPGDYTLVVTEDDPSGGEGPGPDADSRNITVQ